jgi:hypothetical protein
LTANTRAFPNRLLNAPLIRLPNPREYTLHVFIALAAGVALGAAGMRWLGWPFWSATAAVLATLLIPGVMKWRADERRYGRTAIVLSFLLVTKGFHTFEHIAQWTQYHILHWTARASTGLLSAADSEGVHFYWNWIVVLLLVTLIQRGMRNGWAWVLLIWAVAHTLEHTYMFVRYELVLADMHRMGVTGVTAQGLPGILGRDEWLARSVWTQGTFLSRIPGLTTAIRLDVHFWWNVGEAALLLVAAHTYLRATWPASDAAPIKSGPCGMPAPKLGSANAR